ncbi:MAG: hypothetical protein Q8M91_18815 [Polaromonas sp.]|uniref:hypothetical protein n=1 Tax=Nitrosomonas sp. TaxID=42353 RepID=UPI00272F427A|nr:hypothetical protein [Nitrosomonas sp.]MDP1788005.1 hypothetical protein [Nitrosomonas sp.]MDP2224363.1 hypothetical protein [Nitrosomonas sp.]MDP3172385.1 hypothetical protein [Polaromonas sp.]
MSKNITIECPHRESEDEDFDLLKYFKDRIEDLKPALDLSVEHLDDRACFFGVEIIDIQEDENSVFIQYDVTYTAYYGCRDQDHSGEDDRDVTGFRVGNYWEFPVYVPPPRRSTYEEF